uniref:Uncharacterized protein n=1 Tax=Aegilops tauschii subsp. strangulata TaxID=200361 RepID=A0A453AFK8_AEGTS
TLSPRTKHGRRWASPATRRKPTDSPRLPLPFPPIYLTRRRQNHRHHQILAPRDSGPVGSPPVASAMASPCLHPTPAQLHALGVQPRPSGSAALPARLRRGRCYRCGPATPCCYYRRVLVSR